jgi:hypothetical protein
MEPASQKPATPRGWRFPLTAGLAIGLALPVARAVAANLEPSLGYWWALALGTVTAGAVGGLVGAVAGWLLRPASKGTA